MTRIAIISDVHADAVALREALAQVDRLGCSAILCAGDIIDYGAYPEETIALLREVDIPCIRGNHERWYLQKSASSRSGQATVLSNAALRYLEQLPTAWNAVFEGVRIAIRHGTPTSDMDGIYPAGVTLEQAHAWLADVNADVMFVGHTHTPFLLTTVTGGLIGNPGALLRASDRAGEINAWIYDPERESFHPAPAPGGGTFGVLEIPCRRFTVYRASDGVEVEIARRQLST